LLFGFGKWERSGEPEGNIRAVLGNGAPKKSLVSA
jgi:hypothetical protein